MSVADWEALSVIVRAGGRCTPTALAQALRLTSGTVSTRLNRLLQAGLITLGTGTDGRSRPVSVTSDGFARWRRATARRTRSERQIFDELTGDEIDTLNDLLRPLLHRYEATLGTAPRHDLTGHPRPES
ncbi:MarR family transcriptional regulator [Actinomadura sp. KC345]|uniref:MarR family winged helix-turn-helix transcriptional regulator n=1 Tax=Actinomadura sp. KC345 TaxID=2530371 RepID=UPI002442F5A2|nr:MarR family transcriptional regulator [Actinomadura sp. KC345]